MVVGEGEIGIIGVNVRSTINSSSDFCSESTSFCFILFQERLCSKSLIDLKNMRKNSAGDFWGSQYM